MESDWIIDRAKLRELHPAHPDWGARRLKRQVLLQVVAESQEFRVCLEGKEIKRLPIKGLHNQQLLLEDYFTLLLKEAESEWQRYLHKRRHYQR